MPEINLILSCLFAVCAIIGVLNIHKLWQQRQVRGVSMVPPVVYTLVNATETGLFLYMGLYGASFMASLMTVTNAIWLGMALYFANRFEKFGFTYPAALWDGAAGTEVMSDDTMFFGRGIAVRKVDFP